MKQVKDRSATSKGASNALAARIRSLRQPTLRKAEGHRLSDAYREVLRSYRAAVTGGIEPSGKDCQLVREALRFLGGDADRGTTSLADYDHRRYGPFLGVSDEGGAAVAIRNGALASPKSKTLGRKASPLTVGVALDAERLGGVGEVPVGPDEFAEIWIKCVGRLLRTTNVGSRANLRLYLRPPVVTVAAGESSAALKNANTALTAAFKPFLEAPGGPRPLTVSVEFEFGRKRPIQSQEALLKSLREFVKSGGIAAPGIQDIALQVRIGWGAKGRDAVIRAIGVASAARVRRVVVDGVVRKDADSVVSLPGLLNYLPADMVTAILKCAKSKGVELRPANQADPDTIARAIWSALNTARAMGLDLGKYGLFPLSLEQCDSIIGQIQRWFPDWSAAPVFYVDQGIISNDCVYAGTDTENGIKAWLKVLGKHKVRLCLIDTVDKSKGWKILRSGNDSKGLLTVQQITRMSAFGETLGVRTLWAGGITVEQAYELGKLGVFGIYVTTSASREAPVTSEYKGDPALPAEKRPTFMGVWKVKTVLEAGFLAQHLPDGPIRNKIQQAGLDDVALSKLLPVAWRTWWRSARK